MLTKILAYGNRNFYFRPSIIVIAGDVIDVCEKGYRDCGLCSMTIEAYVGYRNERYSFFPRSSVSCAASLDSSQIGSQSSPRKASWRPNAVSSPRSSRPSSSPRWRHSHESPRIVQLHQQPGHRPVIESYLPRCPGRTDMTGSSGQQISADLKRRSNVR